MSAANLDDLQIILGICNYSATSNDIKNFILLTNGEKIENPNNFALMVMAYYGITEDFKQVLEKNMAISRIQKDHIRFRLPEVELCGYRNYKNNLENLKHTFNFYFEKEKIMCEDPTTFPYFFPFFKNDLGKVISVFRVFLRHDVHNSITLEKTQNYIEIYDNIIRLLGNSLINRQKYDFYNEINFCIDNDFSELFIFCPNIDLSKILNEYRSYPIENETTRKKVSTFLNKIKKILCRNRMQLYRFFKEKKLMELEFKEMFSFFNFSFTNPIFSELQVIINNYYVLKIRELTEKLRL